MLARHAARTQCSGVTRHQGIVSSYPFTRCGFGGSGRLTALTQQHLRRAVNATIGTIPLQLAFEVRTFSLALNALRF